jgi:hypothetical protein
MLQTFLNAVAPIIIETVTAILALIAPVIVGQVAVLLRQKSRVEANREIEQLRARVSEVIVNGAQAATAAGLDAAVPDTVDKVLTYVIEGAPQALSRLKPTEAVLRSRIEAALAAAKR